MAAAFAADDLRRFRERTEVERLEWEEERLSRSRKWKEQLEENLRRRTSAKLQALRTISDTLERTLDHLEESADLTGDTLAQRRAELTGLLEHLHDREASIRTRTAQTYRRALRILRANPSAKAKKDFSEAMESLRKLSGGRRER